MNKIVLPLLIAIILAGCNVLPKQPVANPTGRVIVDGEQYPMIQGDYELIDDNVEISSSSSPAQDELAELFETVEVAKSDTLKFEIDKDPASITVIKLNEDGSTDNIDMRNNEIMMPSESGYYIYQVTAQWNNGEAEFVFDVNVE